MLRRLLSSNKLTHKDAAKRLGALRAIEAPSEEELATCARLAGEDPDTDVRLAALALLEDATVIADLCSDEHVGGAATARLAAITLARRDATHLGLDSVRAACIASAGAEHVEFLLTYLEHSEHLAELALRLPKGPQGDVLAHPALNCEAGWQVLERASRGRDKGCNRHARERLETLKTARAGANEASTRIEEVDAAIGRELKTHPENNRALIAHRQKLAALDGRRQAACEAWRARHAELQDAGADTASALPANPLAGHDLTVPDPRDDPFARHLAELEDIDAALGREATASAVRAKRHETVSAWLAGADRLAPEPEQHARFEALSARYAAFEEAHARFDALRWSTEQTPGTDMTDTATLRAWLKTWGPKLDGVRWPEQFARPTSLVALTDAVTQVADRLAQADASQDAKRAELDTLIARIEAALDAGESKAATRDLGHARALQKKGARGYDKTLNALGARVAELRDWQKFATNPKREELLAELEGIQGLALELPAQAQRLKALRERWQALGPVQSGEEAALQVRFDELAEAAFAPCRAYFEAEAKARASNLAAREALCAQVGDYLDQTDWANADIKGANDILRAARAEWRQHHPCDRRALAPVQERFEALQSALHDKIKAAGQANIEAKQALVAQAEALTQPDPDDGVDRAQPREVKALQAAWRDIGFTPRGADQRLWRAFRAACDAVFAQRDEAAKAAALEREAASKAADAQRVRRHEAKLEAIEQWRVWDQAVSSAECRGEPIEPPHPLFAPRVERLLNQAVAQERADLLELVLRAEIAADVESPEAEARLALKMDMLKRGERGLDREGRDGLMKAFCAAGPKTEADDTLRDRLFAALDALER